MKIATYTRFGESARRLGMVLGDQIIDLEDNGIDGNMMSVITGGVDTVAIDAATVGKPGVDLSSVRLHAPVPLQGSFGETNL